MIDIFIPQDEEQLMILNRTPPHNQIKVLEIPTSTVNGLRSIANRGIETGLTDYCVETDTFCVRVDPMNGRREMLIAKLEAEGKMCLLSRVYLD